MFLWVAAVAAIGVVTAVILWLKKRTCVFCGIISKDVHAVVLHEDDLCICFKDISPAGAHHVLVVPKQHIPNVNHLSPADSPLVRRMGQVGREVMKKILPSSTSFVMAFTRPPFNTVPHLHLHCVSMPLTCGWPRGLGLTSCFISAKFDHVYQQLDKKKAL